MKKKQLLAWILPATDARFRKLIQEKYTRYERGLLSHEVDQALQSWIALHTGTQNTLVKNAPNPTPRVATAFIQVKNYLRNNYFENLKVGQEVPKVLFERSIMAVRGSDKRTVAKWVKIFHNFHLVKPTVGNLWEIL